MLLWRWQVYGGRMPGADSTGRAVDCLLGRRAASDTEEFLASMLPRLVAADTALHNGDAAPRKALWSTTDPVPLFGAAMMATEWPEIEATFDRLATRFSNCASFEIEVVAAGANSPPSGGRDGAGAPRSRSGRTVRPRPAAGTSPRRSCDRRP